MSYPKDLEEYSDQELLREVERRFGCWEDKVCSYCHRRLHSDPPCKMNALHTLGVEDALKENLLPGWDELDFS